MSDTNPYWPLPTPDSLGGLVGADDVRDKVTATIDEWSPFYLTAVAGRLAAAGTPGIVLNPFGDWQNTPEFRNLGTGQPAAFQVTVPHTVGTPQLQRNGQYIAVWRAQIAIQVFGTTWDEAADRVSWYEKAVRWSVLQHRSLGGFAMSTKWVGVQYAGVEHTSTRTEGQAIIGLDVQVGDVLDISRSPATPVIPPQDPTVNDVIVTITKYPVTEPLPQEGT